MAHDIRIHPVVTLTHAGNITLTTLSPSPSPSPAHADDIYSNYEDPDRNKYFGIADRDVPILIGAAAGAVGLVVLILGAVVIWYCCQFAFKREKSLYSIDYESDRGSVSSEGTMPFSESMMFMGQKISSDMMDNMKRSQSAPLNVNKLGMKGGKRVGCDPNADGTKGDMRSSHLPGSRGNELRQMDGIEDMIQSRSHGNQNHRNSPHHGRSGNRPKLMSSNSMIETSPGGRGHLYVPASISQLVEDPRTEIFHLTSSSASSRSSQTHPGHHPQAHHPALGHSPNLGAASAWRSVEHNETFDEEEEDEEASYPGRFSRSGERMHKVNFSKKRKNRMLSDSAAAIAMSKAGMNFLPLQPPSMSMSTHPMHGDKESLVDNEAFVVYDERTAL